MTHDMYILLSYCYILDTSHQFIRILYKIYLCANNAYRSVPMAPWPPLSKASSSSSLFSVAVLDPSLWSDLIEYSAVTMTIYHLHFRSLFLFLFWLSIFHVSRWSVCFVWPTRMLHSGNYISTGTPHTKERESVFYNRSASAGSQRTTEELYASTRKVRCKREELGGPL